MIDQKQVEELLGAGLGPEVVATAVGCSQGYITQLLAQDDFRDRVAALRTVALQSHGRRDKTIDGLEDKVLDKLRTAIDSGFIYKANDLLNAFRVINAAKRRGLPTRDTMVVNNVVVQLQLPTKTVEKFTISKTGEVIEIEDRSMVTMPAQQLLKSLADRSSGSAGEQYERAAKYLPSAVKQAARAADG